MDVQLDANGALVVRGVGAGGVGPLTALLSLALSYTSGYLSVTNNLPAGTTESPLRPLANLLCTADSNGTLRVAEKAAGTLRTPPRPFANARGRTDESGALLVCRAGVAAALGPRVPLSKARVSTDEHGYVLIAEGP